MSKKQENSSQNHLAAYTKIMENIEAGVSIFSGIQASGSSVYHHILNNALNNANVFSFAKAARLGKQEIEEAQKIRDKNIELIRQLEELPAEIVEELQHETDVHKIAKKYCGGSEVTNVEGLMNGLLGSQ